MSILKVHARLILGITLLFGAVSVFGQSEPGRRADASGTFSFVSPAEWTVKPGDEDGFALTNKEQTIILLIKAHNYADFNAFANDADIAADGLQVIGKPQAIPNGTHFRTAKQMQSGTLVVDACVLFSERGGGVILTTLTDSTNAAAAFDTCLSVSKTVIFTEPKVSNANSPLSGKHLLYLYTGNGYSERKDIYLCASGAFYQSTGMGGFTPNDADGASFGAMGKKHGTWSIAGTKLLLTFQNGSTTSYAISKRAAGNEIGLNGARYFVQDQNRCQ